MNIRHLFRSLLLTAAGGAAMVSGLGCLPQNHVAIGWVDFSPAFTLDRQPVAVDGSGNPTDDPRLGRYRRAPGAVASLLFPDVAEADHLLQADCFWAGRGPSGGGDLLRLNWETFAAVTSQHDGKYLPADDADVSACRLDDPLTRQPKQFSSPNAPQLPSTVLGVPIVGSLSVAFDGQQMIPQDFDIAFENGAEWYGVSLVAVRPPAPDPDRACDLAAFTGSEEAIMPGTWSYDGGADAAGRVALCSGEGRRVIPELDARFRAGLDEGGLVAEQWFDAVMVASDGERIVRPAAVQGNAVAWSVPTSAQRWHENFSPSLRVEAVRVLRRVGGMDTYLVADDLEDAALCVRPSANDTGCLYQFPADVDANGDVVWRPLAPPNGGSVRNLTPAYDVDALAGLGAGESVADPLEWLVTPSDPLDLHFEFTMSVILAPIAVRVDALTQFGQVPPGETRYRHLTVTNLGGRSVSIDALSVSGPDAGEFQVVPLADPRPVPVGLEVISEGQPEVWIAPDYEEFPVYELQDHERGSVLRRADLDGESFEVNGYGLEFDGPTLTHSDPGAEFQPAVFTAERTRPLNLISHRLVALPLSLAPGENLRLRVRFDPGPPGEKQGQVRIEYHDPTDGTPGAIESAIVAAAQWGPIPSVLPQIVIFDDSSPSHTIRNVLLENSGDLPLEVSDYRVLGPDDDRIGLVAGPPAPFEVLPGQFETFTLEYLDVCASFSAPVEHEAELWLDTNAGRFSVPIRMQSVAC